MDSYSSARPTFDGGERPTAVNSALRTSIAKNHTVYTVLSVHPPPVWTPVDFHFYCITVLYIVLYCHI